MERDEDLSAASGTLVDHEEMVYPSQRILSGLSDSDKADRTHWRDAKVDAGSASSSMNPMDRRGNRSCSNTRRLERIGRHGTKSHSHNRHPIPRHRPVSHFHHFRKHAEFTETPCDPFNVYTAGIKELSDRMALGQLTSVAILETYLRHIDRHNDTLRAIVHLAPRDQLYRLARQRDVELGFGRDRGSLHGIPILVK